MDITELLSAPHKSQIIEHLPYDDYARIPALRSHQLGAGVSYDAEHQPIISPFHIKAAYEGRMAKEDTESMLFGRALHCLLLEPKEFEARYCAYDGRRDERTKAYQEFLAESVGKEVLKVRGALSWEWCMEAATELLANDVVKPFVAVGAREVSVVAEVGGLPCKARIDWLSISAHAIVDVKTTRAIAPLAFYYEFKRYGYGQQMAMYQEVYRVASGKHLPVFLIVIENKPPFSSVVYSVPQELLDRELRTVKKCVGAVQKGLETGQWLAWGGNEVRALEIPDWCMQDEDLVDWEG